ncbi:ribonuclease E inhibitor RraB [Hoeflea marina]|uniref:ribonuclease E inhibitor RraB n=1 Tax=Hoeflea marina TaxID=274592 RepID=UPI001304F572
MAIRRDSFPSDDDGETLYSLAVRGVDLRLKRKIDFYCHVKDCETAKRICEDLITYGYNVSIFESKYENRISDISVYMSIEILPKYEILIMEQNRINLLLSDYGVKCDGWGTLVS